MTRFAFEVSVAPDHPSLAGHFPGRPIVPGVLLLDEAMQALLSSTGRSLTRLQQVKFLSALLPGEVAQGDWEVSEQRASFRLSVLRGGVDLRVAEGAGTLSAEPA